MAGNDANTVLLLHCDGANASTTFTDLSANAHTVTVGGSAQVSTTSPKFGTGSLSLGGGSDKLTLGGTTSDWSWSGTFTVDFWIKTSTFSLDTLPRRPISMAAAGATVFELIFFDGAASSNLGVYVNGLIVTGTIAVADGSWHHIACSRDGSNNVRLFVDGVQSGSTASNSASFAATAPVIGAYAGGTGAIVGNMDEVRFSKGIARWTAGFTPPTLSYGPPDLTMSAGSYALTGATATFAVGHIYTLVMTAGSYVLTGAAMTFRRGMTAAAGAYALTGAAATLKKAVKLSLAAGSYVLTGAAVTRAHKFVAAAGSYILTGLALIETEFPPSRRVIRATKYVLQKLRTTDPTLDQ